LALASPLRFRIKVGVDITAVERMARLVGRYPRSQERLFTNLERDYCLGKREPHAHLAGRFAAKEAVLKMFGTGLARGVRWTDVEITNAPDGRPQVRLMGELAAIAQREGLADLDISVSHDKGFAIAYAVGVWRT
jgi:holo-[acyl-carrier protein] synthase